MMGGPPLAAGMIKRGPELSSCSGNGFDVAGEADPTLGEPEAMLGELP